MFKRFGCDFKSVAIPTGLFLNGLTALSASIYYLRSRIVGVKGAVPMIVTSFIGAPLGAVCTHRVPTPVLIVLFAIGMVVAGGRMWLTSGRAEPKELKRRTVAQRSNDETGLDGRHGWGLYFVVWQYVNTLCGPL